MLGSDDDGYTKCDADDEKAREMDESFGHDVSSEAYDLRRRTNA